MPDGLRVRNPASGIDVDGSWAVPILDLFGRWREPGPAAKSLRGQNRRSVLEGIGLLRRHGFLLPDRGGPAPPSRAVSWRGNLAAAQYHAACRDPVYLERPAEADLYVRTEVLTRRRPERFRRYRSGQRQALPRDPLAGDAPLSAVLSARRTVRRFRRAPVALGDFARLVRATFGLTGVLMTDAFGALGTKTSPSAGALHPIEAYFLVWNVAGLAPAIYHYDVLGDELRILRRGDFRRAAVAAASGQAWVGRAAFLCVMAADFARVLWKYASEDSYRTLFLDAGHVAQTFCLVATSLGLGPFTTAAMQDSKIEALLGLDGVAEFPVYLCGAGLPEREERRGERPAPAPPPRVRPRRSLR